MENTVTSADCVLMLELPKSDMMAVNLSVRTSCSPRKTSMSGSRSWLAFPANIKRAILILSFFLYLLRLSEYKYSSCYSAREDLYRHSYGPIRAKTNARIVLKFEMAPGSGCVKKTLFFL